MHKHPTCALEKLDMVVKRLQKVWCDFIVVIRGTNLTHTV